MCLRSNDDSRTTESAAVGMVQNMVTELLDQLVAAGGLRF